MAHHLDVLAGKTGSLIATSLRFGAMFAGCPAATVEILAEFGELLGVAFQLSDDLLDIASESEQSGKTPGTDLREGVHTLPMLYALAADPAEGPDTARLQELLTMDLADDAAFEEALVLIRAHGCMDRRARSCAATPSAPGRCWSRCRRTPPRTPCGRLCDVVLSRTA